jgi:RNA polymerase sigma-70 factor (ECF subfamily)
MSNSELYDPLRDPFTIVAVQRKATQLAAHPGFSEADRDDLAQELLIHVHRCFSSFDAGVGHAHPYVATIIDRQAKKLIRKCRADKRSTGQRTASLNVSICSEAGATCELIQLLGPDDGDRRLERERRRSDEDLSDLRQDMETVLSTFPPRWREMLELCKSMSLTEVAVAMGVPRTTLQGWMLRVRERCIEAGLEDYFHK